MNGETCKLEIVEEIAPCGKTFLKATGEMDLRTGQMLKTVLRRAADRGGDVIADFQGITFIDSPCLGILLAEHHRRLKEGRWQLHIILSERLARIFQVMGLVGLLNVTSATDHVSDEAEQRA